MLHKDELEDFEELRTQHAKEKRALEDKVTDLKRIIQLNEATITEHEFWENSPAQVSKDHQRVKDENNHLTRVHRELSGEVNMLKRIVTDQQAHIYMLSQENARISNAPEQQM